MKQPISPIVGLAPGDWRGAERGRLAVAASLDRWDCRLRTFCPQCIAREGCSRRLDVIEQKRAPDYFGRYPLTDGDGSW